MLSNSDDRHELLRRIPAVDQVLLMPGISAWVQRTSRGFVVSEIQMLLQEIRESIRGGKSSDEITADLAGLDVALDERLGMRLRPALRLVINAAGVLLHTNLGRAPLSRAAQDCLSAVSAHYTNLEYDLAAGIRSHRDKLLEGALREVLGCEAATVVNNNAAAVYLILNTLAAGREVVVSRGELIEIGGSFRIPEILERSGALLREVGTTNKTKIEDYGSAVGEATALILRVHPSNYRIRGFTHRPALKDLVHLAHTRGIPLVEDIGSGCLVDLRPFGIPDEPRAQESLAAGVDLVCFSGDKLMGGPQAGVIAGLRNPVDRIRKNPLMRTYRVDKLVYGALEATLAAYRTGRALEEIPILRLLSVSFEQLKARSARFLRRLKAGLPGDALAELSEGYSVVGGGSCPDCRLRSVLIALTSGRLSPNDIESRLRGQNPAVILRLEEDRALVDLRTVFPAQEAALLKGLTAALS